MQTKQSESAFWHGQVALSATPQRLGLLDHPYDKIHQRLTVKALSTNSATAYVSSFAAVSADNSYALAPGESITIEVDHPSNLWCLGTSPDRLCWIGA